MSPALTAAPTKARRGRPSTRFFSVDECADFVRCGADVLRRLLDTVPGLLPGAVETADGWRVPERALRVVLGAAVGPLPALATVAEVAQCLRLDVSTIYKLLKARDAAGKPVLSHRVIWGQKLVLAADVLALPANRVGGPSSFFAKQEEAAS